MSSIAKPTPSQQTRRLVVLITAVVATVVTYGQLWLGFGQSEEQLAAQGDQTLEVAGYAFSIWGLIYLGILIYAVRQVLPRTGESTVLNRLGWPSAATFVGLALWVVASAADWKWATVVLIFAQWLALLLPMLALSGRIRSLSRWEGDRTMVVWPLAALVGWLTAAAPLNLVTVLTATGALPASPSQTVWAILVLAAVVLITLAVTARLRTLAYPLPVAWALVGAFAAEQADSPVVGFTALAGAAAVLIGAVILTFRLKAEPKPAEAPRAEAVGGRVDSGT